MLPLPLNSPGCGTRGQTAHSWAMESLQIACGLHPLGTQLVCSRRPFPTVESILRQWDSGQQPGLSPALPVLLQCPSGSAGSLAAWASYGFGMSLYLHKGSSEKAGFLACWWVARVFPERPTYRLLL